MKNEYDFWVNKRNTPHLVLYTKLLGVLGRCLAINFFVSSIYALYIEQKKYAIGFVVLGVLIYSRIGTKLNDPRREERGLISVIMEAIMFTICTLGIVYSLEFFKLMFVYVFEIICVTNCILKYFKQNKN